MNLRLKRFEKLLSHLIHEWFAYYKPSTIHTYQFTIENIEISGDLRQARVHITSLSLGESVIIALQPHLKSIQAHISRNIKSKNVPKISFVFDKTATIIKNLNSIEK
jgi:ribosome-binding factor A